jgi:twinkle protein
VAKFVGHEACPDCGSADNLGRYDDGSAWCFTEGCKHWEGPEGSSRPSKPPAERPDTDWKRLKGHYQDITGRKISEKTAKRWGYQYSKLDDGTDVHLMNIYDDNRQLIGQKTRTKDKDFSWRGPAAKDPPIYGSWLWPGKGRSVILTEGEIDAMTWDEAQDNKWPVGSLPNGTGSVEKAIVRDYEKLLRFDTIYLSFDADEPGQKALATACELLPAGRVKIITFPEGCKDASDVMRKRGPGDLIRAYWDAKDFRPDGIVLGEELQLEDLMQGCEEGFPLPYPKLQEMTYGLRKGELTLITAGSGIGKSTWAREIAYDLHQNHACKIGNVYLEEKNRKTAQGYIALHMGVPLGRLRHKPDTLSKEQWDAAREATIAKNMVFYDHFGSLESTRLLNKMRYMAQVLKVDFIVLDHISIVTSGEESSSEGERKDIDILMTRLQSLIQETGVGILAIVHLKRTKKDKSFNEGGTISLSDLRGSGGLEQLSDNVYGLERNQQAKKKAAQTKSRIRVLKCRESGETGEADVLDYNRQTGRNEVSGDFPDDDNNFDPHDNEGDAKF